MTKFKPHKQMTLAQWHEWRIENYLTAGRKQISVDKNYHDLDKINAFGLGQKKLSSITRSDIQMYMNEVGPRYRKQTMIEHMGRLKSAFNDAVIDGWIRANPAGRYDLVSMENFMTQAELKKIREEKKSLELDEYYRLLKIVDSYVVQLSSQSQSGEVMTPRITIATAIYVVAKTGMRYAEVLGLTKEDIDFNQHTIRVEKTWDYKSTKGGFAQTKNFASIRTIEVDEDTIRVIGNYYEWLANNGVGLNQGAIFVPSGTRPFNSSYNNLLKQFLETVGVEPLTLHKLRHTHASILIANHVPLMVIAKRLGHTDTNMIQRVYGHLLEGTEEEGNKMVLRII